ncbi:MAG: lysophospholipid acyltransferase family protein, partial [Anaerolineae bacterium]
LGLFLARRAPLSLSYRVASLLGDLVYLGWPHGRANAIDNMRHVLGRGASQAEVRRTARNSFRNYFKVLVDFARLWQLDRVTLTRALRGKGWENLDQALAGGKGVLLVGSHLGNWDLAGVALALNNYPVHAVADTQGFGSPRVNRAVLASREAFGIRIIPVEAPLRRIYRALAANEAVGIVADRPPKDSRGVPVTFFGDETRWPTGVASIALRTGAAIVTGYLVRGPDGGFDGEMLAPLAFEPKGDKDEDLRRLTQEIVAVQERLIQQFPDQWYMFRRMWPNGR